LLYLVLGIGAAELTMNWHKKNNPVIVAFIAVKLLKVFLFDDDFRILRDEKYSG